MRFTEPITLTTTPAIVKMNAPFKNVSLLTRFIPLPYVNRVTVTILKGIIYYNKICLQVKQITA
jgi:hypothetical protein